MKNKPQTLILKNGKFVEDAEKKLPRTRLFILKGGSPAEHKLGDIRRDEDDVIRVSRETEEYYIGTFITGMGFIDVKFKKSDCRELTQEEIEKLNQAQFGMTNLRDNEISYRFGIIVNEKGELITKTWNGPRN